MSKRKSQPSSQDINANKVYMTMRGLSLVPDQGILPLLTKRNLVILLSSLTPPPTVKE